MSVAESADSDVQDHPLLNSDLLSELCCYGVVADNKAIADSACKICASLLSCDNEEVWSRVWGMVNQWMPFLEVCVWGAEGLLMLFRFPKAITFSQCTVCNHRIIYGTVLLENMRDTN